MFNQEISFKLGQQEKYQKFVQWCKENGALVSDDVLYPSAFGSQGFTGVSAKNDIPANKIIIAIPNKLIITYDKVFKSELEKMFVAHKQFFDEQVTADAEFNCLALYIFYHKLQGEKSFWYPYLEVVEQHTMFEWRNRNLFNLQDQALVDEFMYVLQEMDATWYKFKGVMNKYPEFYGSLTEHHKDIFYWSNEFVMTRCFGWTLPSTSLVPLADMLNHSFQNPATYHLVKRNFEQSGKAQQKYTLKRERIDMSLISVNCQLDPKYSINNPQDAYIQTNKELLIHQYEGQTNREKINQINYHVLKLWKEKQAWELDYESSSQSEDNDTDSEDEEKDDKFLQIRKKEMKIIEQRKNKTDQQNLIKCSEIITTIIPKNAQFKQSQPQIKGKKQFTEDKEESESGESSDDSEKDFDWYDDNDDDVYFCITSAGPIQKGDQIYTFYGRRNNRFLLLWYGFTIQNNKYNSYNFRLWLNPDPMPMSDQIYQKIIMTNTINLTHIKQGQINNIPLKQLSRQIKLKGTKLQEDLIIYMRLFLMAYYCGQDANSVLLTIPVSLDFEIQVFDFTLKFLSYIAQKFKTSYQDDIQLDENQLSSEEIFALNYRVGQKELVLLQINHIIEALQLLKALKLNGTLNIKEYFMTAPNGMEKMRALRYYLQYLYQVD